MSGLCSRDGYEAEQLLERVQSWTREEVEQLPKLYREKAREFRQLSQRDEG